MIKIFDVTALIAYCLLIYGLSAQESLPAPMWFEHQDKLHHAIAYGMMGIFAWRAIRHLVDKPIIRAFAILVFCSLYGVSDEWHQAFVPGRDSGAADWLADTVGAALAIGVFYRWQRGRTKN
jgi:VanZ family protein